MRQLSVYIAGKVSPNSSFGTSDWRRAVCRRLAKASGLSLRNLDPTKGSRTLPLDEGNAVFVFGRDCFMIKSADVVVVYLSDDISVGGSQEMLIAKYFGKPLIGIAPKGGKFHRATKDIAGRVYYNWTHPFVKVPCDYVVATVEEAGVCLKRHFTHARTVRNLSFLDDVVQHYQTMYASADTILHGLGLSTTFAFAQKGLIVDWVHRRMLVIEYAAHPRVAEKVRGRLGLPGGKIKPGASLDGSFAERVQEETGVTIQPSSPFFLWEFRYERNGVRQHVVACAREASYVGGFLHTPERGDEVDLAHARWVELQDVFRQPFIEEERVIIKQFLATTTASTRVRS